MNNYHRNLMCIKGFCDGAGARVMNPKYMDDSDYNRGYMDGQKTKHKYAEQSAKHLGVSVREIVPLPITQRNTY